MREMTFGKQTLFLLFLSPIFDFLGLGKGEISSCTRLLEMTILVMNTKKKDANIVLRGTHSLGISS